MRNPVHFRLEDPRCQFMILAIIAVTLHDWLVRGDSFGIMHDTATRFGIMYSSKGEAGLVSGATEQ